MARRRRNRNSGSLLLLGIVALGFAIPKEAWIGIGIAAAIGLAVYFGQKWKRTGASAESVGDKFVTRYEDASQPVNVQEGIHRSAEPEFAIPRRPDGFGMAKWLPLGQSIQISNVVIPGGLIYVGTSLPASNGEPDPCLINPSLSISAHDSGAERDVGYWWSYSQIPPSARRSYLMWLAGGRQDPNVDVGYAFLFFYGLERRVLLDAPHDPEAAAELPIIAEEVQRLLKIFGERSGSFRYHASELLDWLSLANPPPLYRNPVPSFPRTFELPLYVRLALGQTAIDRVPVPADLALAWARLEPSIRLRTPATRCAKEFDDLFRYKYKDAHGDGILLPRNRTKLKFVYRPASGGFRWRGEIKMSFGDIPDVTALTAPLRSLQSLVEDTTVELEAYSRLVGRNPDAKTSIEALLLLPVRMWPDTTRKNLAMLKVRLTRAPRVMLLGELLALLGAQDALTRDKMKTLVCALDAIKVGFEPDILVGAKFPKINDKIVVFATSPEDASARATPAYRAAALTLELSSSIAAADGEIGADEFEHLRQEVQRWCHLSAAHRDRLTAHLALLREAPVSLSTIRKKLEGLASNQKEAIAAFMATVAQADGVVSPDEVKILERAYKALGVEPKKVFSDLHAVAAGARPEGTSPQAVEPGGFKLDRARIATLQKETQQVSALLASIFTEEEPAPVQSTPEPEPEASESPRPEGVLGLDTSHAAFARLLLSRPQWTREELDDVALDLELMLDGALERINEASFEAYDIPFTEGDDPIEVNAELLRRLET